MKGRRRWGRGWAIGLIVMVTVSQTISAQQVGTCDPAKAEAFLDAGNVRARILNDGALFGRTDPFVYEAPKGGGVNAVFHASLWVAGQVRGDVRMAATRYAQAEFWPGPLDADGNPPSDCAPYDHLFEITREDLEQFAAFGVVSENLEAWPATLGAPVVNGDGIADNYNLDGGDRPALVGDQMLWWVMNDAGGEHAHTETVPLHVEVQGAAFAFAASPVALGAEAVPNATFYRYRFIYKGAMPLDSAYVALFVDPDLGGFRDDYVGADTTLSLGFAYNSEEVDEQYGARPPAVGVLLLQGPAVSRDGTPHRLPMTAFAWEGNLWPCDVCELVYREYYYNLMQGRTFSGRPFTEGGDGAGFGGPPMPFAFPGDPVTHSFWSEENWDGEGLRNYPGDRRFILSSGPFMMQPGEEQEIVVAVLWARGDDRLDSVRRLRHVAAGIRGLSRQLLQPRLPDAVPGPSGLRFEATYPNPFRGATTIRYSLSDAARVRLVVYDVLGREVATLVEADQGAGVYEVVFDGSGLPGGVYFYQMEIKGHRFTRAMVVR